MHVYQDGSIQLNHGGTEMGQGLFQKVAQVAAGVFGLRREPVKITATDTGKVPNTSATAASSGSDLNGMAVQGGLRHDPGAAGRVRCGTASGRSLAMVRVRRGRGAGGGRRTTALPKWRAMAYQARVSAVLDRVLRDAEDRLGPGARGVGGRSSTSPMARR